MRSLTQTIVVCMAVGVLTGGCAVIKRHKPIVGIHALRQGPPTSVAVLPFTNQSDNPMAADAARDALFYALAERGFRMVDLADVDRVMRDPKVAGLLRNTDGGIDAKAAGRLFGAEAIAVGRITEVKAHDAKVITLTKIKAQVWLIDTRSDQIVWQDETTAYVCILDRPRRQKSATPAERRQAPLLRLCRSFDALWEQLVKKLPSVAPDPEVSGLTIRRLAVRPGRLVVSVGDRVEIVAEGTPGCIARATLGTLGKTVTLQESQRTRGVYRGSYTVKPGDHSSYCRVGVKLQSGASHRREIAEPRSAFVIDAIPPTPPTGLAFETQPTGVVLTWDRPASHDLAHYLVYRSESTTGTVRPLGRPEVENYFDRIDHGPARFLYFVKAVDHAGNPSSSSAELAVDLPARGPSRPSDVIEGEVRWTAFGGPYRLAKDVDVGPGARLIIEPGTQVEIPPGMEITVRGTVEAIGRPNYPIRLVGEEASRGFHLADPDAILRASYVEIAGARVAIKVANGECYLDQVTLRDNVRGINVEAAKRLILSHSTILRNTYGVVARGACEIRSTEFVQNQIGLRIIGDETTVDRSLFDNIQLDIVKLGNQPLIADGNTFWTANPSTLFRHLWGNVTCRTMLVRKWPGKRERGVRFKEVADYLEEGRKAAIIADWEGALKAYEAALLQERNREIVDQALKIYKQIVAKQGALALDREIEFCRSAVLTHPHDAELLKHLAMLYDRTGQAQMARAIRLRIQRLESLRQPRGKKALPPSESAPR